MEFNWFTFAAQIVNFLILVFVLKHFLFNRILTNMDQRSQSIQARLNKANATQLAAEQEKKRLVEEKNEFEGQKEKLLAESKADVEGKKQVLLRKAREEVNKQHERWMQALDEEQESLLKSFESETRQYVLKISQKALSDLASADLQEQLIRRFMSHYQNLPQEQKNRLHQAVQDTGQLTITTGMPLDDSWRDTLRDTLCFSEAQVTCQVQPELLMGLCLKANGYKLDWNIQMYLREMEAAFLDTLKAHRRERQKMTEAKRPKSSDDKKQQTNANTEIQQLQNELKQLQSKLETLQSAQNNPQTQKDMQASGETRHAPA